MGLPISPRRARVGGIEDRNEGEGEARRGREGGKDWQERRTRIGTIEGLGLTDCVRDRLAVGARGWDNWQSSHSDAE